MNKHVTSATRYVISFVLVVTAFDFFLRFIGVSAPEARVGMDLLFMMILGLSWAHALSKDEPEEKPKERKKVKEV